MCDTTWLCHLAIFLYYVSSFCKGDQVTKPIIVVKISCKLQTKGFLIKCFNFLALRICCQSFWLLITIAASDWPSLQFCTAKLFCLGYAHTKTVVKIALMCFNISIFQEISFSFNPSARILQPNDLTYLISYTVNTTEIFTKDINSTQYTRIMISSASEILVS